MGLVLQTFVVVLVFHLRGLVNVEGFFHTFSVKEKRRREPGGKGGGGGGVVAGTNRIFCSNPLSEQVRVHTAMMSS